MCGFFLSLKQFAFDSAYPWSLSPSSLVPLTYFVLVNYSVSTLFNIWMLLTLSLSNNPPPLSFSPQTRKVDGGNQKRTVVPTIKLMEQEMFTTKFYHRNTNYCFGFNLQGN